MGYLSGDLPGWREVADIMSRVDTVPARVEVEFAVRMRVGTNNIWKYSPMVLEDKFRLLDRKLKSRIPWEHYQKCYLFQTQNQSDRGS